MTHVKPNQFTISVPALHSCVHRMLIPVYVAATAAPARSEPEESIMRSMLRIWSVCKHACHALSIDERKSFTPTLWQEAPGGEHRIEPVWFTGVHSNVGGGYPKQGMSLAGREPAPGHH